ncbi:hypothetical protein [Saccharopolyspora endophytica]|uniref:Uncharacterized protein n=1 Tax=Saccharopolyspora endophytica TaxID=543886 RepID=A0ABS5DQS7_9PSEU|nr:hypothetical protein [Saccharopolyspora endophytica]MBQ0928640.1 hypothetical protein [Saccharopolyspora endophytica]
MHDPDRWLRLGVHWNAYVGIDDDDPLAAMSTRDRLTTASTAVLMAPEEACAPVEHVAPPPGEQQLGVAHEQHMNVNEAAIVTRRRRSPVRSHLSGS